MVLVSMFNLRVHVDQLGVTSTDAAFSDVALNKNDFFLNFGSVKADKAD